jgi:hypothetical protein
MTNKGGKKMNKIYVIFAGMVLVALLSFSGCTAEPVTTTVTDISKTTMTKTDVSTKIETVTETTTITDTVTETIVATSTSSKTSTTSQSTPSLDEVKVEIKQINVGAKVTGLSVELTENSIIITGRVAQYDMGSYTVTINCEFYNSSDEVIGTFESDPWRLEAYGANPWDFEIIFNTDEPASVARCLLTINGLEG